MSKKLKILLFVLILSAASLTVYVTLTRKSSAPTNNNSNTSATSFPISNNSSNKDNTQPFKIPSKDDPKMTIHTPKEDVVTNNVYKNPIDQLSRNGVSFRNNDKYYIAFYPTPPPGGFVITLMSKDLATNRALAEKDFLDTLGITKDQACQFNISLAVPKFVSEKASGIDYKLSFCPDGKPLPK